MIVKDELSLSDAKFFTEFIKFREYHMSKKEINYFNHINLTLKYYNAAAINVNNKNIRGQPILIHGYDKFILGLIHYISKTIIFIMVCCAVFFIVVWQS